MRRSALALSRHRRCGFLADELCMWHGGGNYVLTAPVGGLVQPSAAGGLPESPETKRRLRNLVEVSGLGKELVLGGANPVSREELAAVHPVSYLDEFKSLSDRGGGELGLRTPFGPGSYEIAALSAGLVTQGLRTVLCGDLDNAYALSRPPGHHCLPEWPNGFCLLNNLAIAIKAARADGLASRFAVIDWDVHHGNGTEHIFYEDPQVLTVSLHQERNYPLDTGDLGDVGAAAGEGYNMNIPLPPGSGHEAYLAAFDLLVGPKVRAFAPDVILVACGFDASGVDPLSRMLCHADTFRLLTRRTLDLADELCGGRVVMSHEGGYSEAHVPFCGHAVLQELSGSHIDAGDPLLTRISGQQPNQRTTDWTLDLIREMRTHFF